MGIENYAKDGRTVADMTEDLRICMPATASAPRFARTLMERRLNKWSYSHIVDDALLVTAEMVANAVKAAAGQDIRLACRWGAETVLIEVWDSSPEPPVPARVVELSLDDLDLSEAAFDTNGGRGLHIVQALAAEWGHHFDPVNPTTGHSPGKWVWARLST